MQEKILITGANGFIGGYLVDEAINQGLDVFAGVCKESNHASLKEKKLQVIYIDFDDEASLVDLMQNYKFDYIIHNAGITKSPDKNQFHEVNVNLLVKLTKAIQKSGVTLRKFVYISSLAAYGPADHQPGKTITEDSIPKPVTEYGRSKLAAERYLKEKTQLPYIIIRPTAVYGPKDKEFLSVFQMVMNRINLQPGLKTQYLTLIFIKDLAGVILKATLSPYTKTAYFINDGSLYSSDHFVRIIKRTLNKKTLNIKVPLFLVKIITFIMENFSKLIGEYSILNTDKVHELEARYWNCDASKVSTELNYAIQYTLEEGVKETADWYQTHKWI